METGLVADNRFHAIAKAPPGLVRTIPLAESYGAVPTGALPLVGRGRQLASLASGEKRVFPDFGRETRNF
jgi:hypothetical protein